MWSETRTYTIKTYHEARDQILIEFDYGKHENAFALAFNYVDENTFVAVDTTFVFPTILPLNRNLIPTMFR